MSKPRILVQLDSDPQASVFDGVVAVDAGVDHLFRHAAVQPQQVRDLVYGAMFTRSPDELKCTAVFIGGSDVTAGEALLAEAQSAFFGPIRVSVMIDSNGANTTAAAAVLAAAKHVDLSAAKTLVLAATGPVGSRVTRLLARAGAQVRAASRRRDRAREVCDAVAAHVADAQLEPVQIDTADALSEALRDVQVVISAGAAGIELLSETARKGSGSLQVAIDLNAVPPLGIEGIQVTDKAVDYDGVLCYGAVGVGGTKMKIHKAAIRRLFESNDQILDAEAIYAIGQQV